MDKVISKEEAEPLLVPLYSAIEDCWGEAWNEWQSLSKTASFSMSASLRARILYEKAAAAAKIRFPYLPGVMDVDEKKRFVIVNIENLIMLRFKKFTSAKSLSTAGIGTNQRTMFDLQAQLEGQGFFDGMPAEMTMVVAGYLLNPLETEMDKKLIACSKGKDLRWSLDINQPPSAAALDRSKAPKPIEPRSTETGRKLNDQEKGTGGPEPE